jgi:hypothetical protein
MKSNAKHMFDVLQTLIELRTQRKKKDWEKKRRWEREREREREHYEKSQIEVATHLKEEKFC